MTEDHLPIWYRRATVLLLLGLIVEALSLLKLHSPTGFLGFAILGGTATIAGIACYLRGVLGSGPSPEGS